MSNLCVTHFNSESKVRFKSYQVGKNNFIFASFFSHQVIIWLQKALNKVTISCMFFLFFLLFLEFIVPDSTHFLTVPFVFYRRKKVMHLEHDGE